VCLFVVLGVFQEYRAQRAIAALKQMAAPTVRGNGRASVRDFEPGARARDVVKLETGAVSRRTAGSSKA